MSTSFDRDYLSYDEWKKYHNIISQEKEKRRKERHELAEKWAVEVFKNRELEKEIKELKKNNEELQQANERLRNTLCFKTIEDLSKKNIELTQEIAKMMNRLVEGLEEKLELQREIEILKYRSF